MKSWEARTKLVGFPFSFQDVDNSSRNYQLEVEAQEIISNVRMSFSLHLELIVISGLTEF